MQLNKKKPVRAALAAATCALLGVAAVASADTSEWEYEAGAMAYSESDSRISVAEAQASAKREFGDEKFLSVKVTADTISGASPNGAAPSDTPQTFTSPSGNTKYTTTPGETPLDPNFVDYRAAVSVDWEQPVSRFVKSNFGAFGSFELDFVSMGASAGVSKDINNRNTTLAGGVSFEYDRVAPTGGTPVSMTRTGALAGKTLDADAETMTVIDALVGVTQVINRNMLVQLNYSLSVSSGYHSNPYKLLSLIDGAGSAIDYVYENRPDNRTKQSLFLRSKYHFESGIADVSYRYLWDSWGITSSTVDLRYRWNFSAGSYLEPHVRFYSQTAADFYYHSLASGAALPAEASADYRLADMNAVTFGVKYGMKVREKQELAVKLEVYGQSGEDNPADAVGVQRNYDFFPEVSAVIVQAVYSF